MSVYWEIYQRDPEAVRESLALATNRALALAELSVEQLLWDAIIRHASDMTCPFNLGLANEGNDAGHVWTELNSWRFLILPFQRMLRSVLRDRRCEWWAAFRDVCRRSTSRSRTGTGGEDYCSVNFEFGRTLLPTVNPGATSFIAEPLWPKTTELTSRQRNARSARPEQTTPIHMCPTCGRGFHSRIGHIWQGEFLSCPKLSSWAAQTHCWLWSFRCWDRHLC